MAIPTGNEEGGQPRKQLGYESGAALMAEGPHAFHDHVATKLETALGRAMPQMDVRFSNSSVTADIVVIDDNRSKHELPTPPDTIMKAFVGPKKRVVHKEILKNVSGPFKPGTITLLLGQPGSGKLLMKILSGRFLIRKNVTVEGDITFNNVPREKIHFATLTVKETLKFAHKFCGGELSRRGEELLTNGTDQESLEALATAYAIFKHYPDVIIEQLGLKNCQDTILGDAMLCGVSSGERERVTTGEMEFGMKYVTLMDEISTGLDSAATYDIINTQRSVAQKLRKTVVIAFLQPSPEVFALFDDVMILNEGELMYHGPCDRVQGYFDSLGFSCPPAYAIPAGYEWLYKIVPHRFAMGILVSLVFADCDQLPDWGEQLGEYVNVGSQLGCQPMGDSPVTVGHITLKEYTEEYFGMKHDEIWMNFGIVVAYTVLFRILGLPSLRYINHQKR
ncbi:hypothetical protein BBJ28_00014377 [Nothophytophthora sp. Chile5]|nr:hypothetical protein BBJ28_00014377 [Nothophytophthora sp. Chile5]